MNFSRYEPDKWRFEKKAHLLGFDEVAGVDEVGRGALAGPVVSAAVVLPKYSNSFLEISDSKKLSPKTRKKLYDLIYNHAVSVGIGIVDPFEIDRINILNASLISMRIAVQNLALQPGCLLLDGTFKLPLDLPQIPIVKGDTLSVSIGAASIVAKVTRDRLMLQVGAMFPEFGFASHKGYSTKLHRNNIKRFGCCCMHRKTFKGVKEFVTLPQFEV